MFTVARLQKKPRHFQSFTGLTPPQFEELLQALRPVYEQAEQERLRRENRRRAAGVPQACRRRAAGVPQACRRRAAGVPQAQDASSRWLCRSGS